MLIHNIKNKNVGWRWETVSGVDRKVLLGLNNFLTIGGGFKFSYNIFHSQIF